MSFLGLTFDVKKIFLFILLINCLFFAIFQNKPLQNKTELRPNIKKEMKTKYSIDDLDNLLKKFS